MLSNHQEEDAGTHRKKDTPCPRTGRRCNKVEAREQSHLKSKLIPFRDTWRAQTNLVRQILMHIYSKVGLMIIKVKCNNRGVN